MKITATQYAKSLYEATRDKSQGEVDVALGNFVKVLGKNSQLKLKENIIKKFGEIYNKENNIVEAEIVSRESLSDEVRTKVCTWVRTKHAAKEVVLKEITDKSIRGGIIIRVGDEVTDGSLAKQLRDLKKTLVA